MPKSPVRSSNGVSVLQENDEARILEAMKQRPEILDTLNQITRSRKKHQGTWDDLATEFDSTGMTFPHFFRMKKTQIASRM